MSDCTPDRLAPGSIPGRPATADVGPCPQRRAVLAALPGVVILPGVLSACGSAQPAPPVSTEQSTTTVPPATVSAAEIGVGEAKQVRAGAEYVIVAQPVQGTYVAYSARCTHKGGTVQVIKGMSLRCPLHSAEFDATSGKNTAPPAPRPLDTVSVVLKGDQLMIG